MDADPTMQRFERIRPLLREQAKAAEEQRQLTAAAHDALVTAGIYDLVRPRALGGEEADLLTMVRAVRSLARSDGSAGWCGMISGVYGAFGQLLPRAGAAQVYATPSTIIAGALAPMGRALRVPGGYQLSGRWPFGSNGAHANWFVGGAVVFEGDVPVMVNAQLPLIKLCFMPRDAVRILDTWTTTGLRATGSHDYTVEDVFVPEERTFWFSDEATGSGPWARLPMVAAFGLAISAVTVGIAEHVLELFVGLAASKKPVLSPFSLQEKGNVHDRVGITLASIEAAIAYLERATSDGWEIACRDQRPTFEQRGKLWLAATHAAQIALTAIESLYTLAGSHSVYELNGIDRCLRDARTAAQHVMTQFLNYEIAGKQRLGLPVMDTIWTFDYRAADPI